MSQQLPDPLVKVLVNPTAPLAAQQAGIDLLFLRAAVRRVHAAEDAFDNTMGDICVPDDVKMALSLAYRRNRAALRAEMATIDNSKEQKPQTITTPPTCVKCGHPKDNHPYRHPFVSTQPNAGEEQKP